MYTYYNRIAIMMKPMLKKNLYRALAFSFAVAMNIAATAGERTVPVDMFILVDKSLSMDEPSEKFDSLKKWTEEQLTGQMLVEGDWLTIYQFYGQAENLLTVTIAGEADKEKVKTVFDAIKPDGRFTDIGLALDTIKASLDERSENGRYKIMLLLTDLRQEAPWTSKYPGVIDPFTSPYLAEARAVDHDGWYEITLDMDIHDQVVTLSKKLYRTIETLQGQAHDVSSDDGVSLDVSLDGEAHPDDSTDAHTGDASPRMRDGSEEGTDSVDSTAAQKIAYTEGGTGIARVFGEEQARGGTNPLDASAPRETESRDDGGRREAEDGRRTDSPAIPFTVYLAIIGIILLLVVLIVVIALIRTRKPADDKKNPARAVDLLDSTKW